MASDDAKWDAFKPEHRPPFVEIQPCRDLWLDRGPFAYQRIESSWWPRDEMEMVLPPAVELEPGDAT